MGTTATPVAMPSNTFSCAKLGTGAKEPLNKTPMPRFQRGGRCEPCDGSISRLGARHTERSEGIKRKKLRPGSDHNKEPKPPDSGGHICVLAKAEMGRDAAGK